MRIINTIFITIVIMGVLLNKANAQTVSNSENSHELFNLVLRQHVIDGNVDYSGIQKDSRYFEYLRYLREAKPETLANDKEKLAF